jgi:hypothetical protein
MSAPDDPNPTPGNNPDAYGTHECPCCGATVKKLPDHLRHNCEATQ